MTLTQEELDAIDVSVHDLLTAPSPEETAVLEEVKALFDEMSDVELKAIVRTPGGRVGNDSPFSHSRSSNWVARAGGLPKYIRVIARGIMKSGKHKMSQAISLAIGTVKRWAKGGGNVSAKVRAAALKAVSEWEAMKVKNRARGASNKKEHSGMETLEHKAAMGGPAAPVVIDDPEKGIVTAIVSVTGVVDNVKDNIKPGAYEKSLATRNPKGVWSHEWSSPVAKALSVKELLPGDPALPKEDRKGNPWPKEAGGLQVQAQFNLKTDLGRNAFENVQFFGDEQEWSIGFQVPAGGSHTDTKTGVRHIDYIELYEFSPVLFGAAPLSTTQQVKSLLGGVLSTKTLELIESELSDDDSETKDDFSDEVVDETDEEIDDYVSVDLDILDAIDGFAENIKEMVRVATQGGEPGDDDALDEDDMTIKSAFADAGGGEPFTVADVLDDEDLDVKIIVRTAAGARRYGVPIGSVVRSGSGHGVGNQGRRQAASRGLYDSTRRKKVSDLSDDELTAHLTHSVGKRHQEVLRERSNRVNGKRRRLVKKDAQRNVETKEDFVLAERVNELSTYSADITSFKQMEALAVKYDEAKSDNDFDGMGEYAEAFIASVEQGIDDSTEESVKSALTELAYDYADELKAVYAEGEDDEDDEEQPSDEEDDDTDEGSDEDDESSDDSDEEDDEKDEKKSATVVFTTESPEWKALVEATL